MVLKVGYNCLILSSFMMTRDRRGDDRQWATIGCLLCTTFVMGRREGWVQLDRNHSKIKREIEQKKLIEK